jgi:hypothetical protein
MGTLKLANAQVNVAVRNGHVIAWPRARLIEAPGSLYRVLCLRRSAPCAARSS